MQQYVFYIEKLNGSKFIEVIKTCKRPRSTNIYKDLINRIDTNKIISFGYSPIQYFIKNNRSFQVDQNNIKVINQINQYLNNK